MGSVLPATAPRSGLHRGLAVLVSAVLALTGLTVAVAPPAAAAVSVTPLGWNVVGLDSNKVTVGPNQFPVGARVCNSGPSAADIDATWQWQSTNPYVNVVGGPGATPEVYPTFELAAGACRDLYWTVEVTRTSAAYLTSRDFQIDVFDGTSTVSTPAGRQIYVEKLVSQNRNTVGGVSGPGITTGETLYTGQTYEYTVTGATAPGGYEQLVFAAIFPPSMFEMVSVETTYSADTSAIVSNPNDQVYADGCGWNNTTRACTGTGKVGGTMSSVYTLRAIGAGSGRVLTEIYDFSGSSFHYNADFGASAPTVTVKQAVADLAVVKTSSPATFDSANDTLTFTITATNTGNLTLTNVTISDPLLGSLTKVPSGTCTAATLAPGESFACTGTYTTEADDVAAGAVTNTASATGTDPAGNSVTKTGTTRVPGPDPNPEITVVKSASPASFTESGQTVVYTVTAANTGNLTLTDVSVTDPKLGVLGCTWPSATTGLLLAGEKVTCTGSYQTTPSDVNSGSVQNTATATGKDPGNNTVTDTGSVTVPGPTPNPVLTVVKSSSPAFFDSANDTLTFTVTASNTGNVTLTDVTVSDPLLVTLTKVGGGECSAASLAPGASLSCTGSYVTDADDVAAGEVTNTATATGKDPSNQDVSDTGSTTVPGPTPNPQLTVVKSASPGSFTASGQTLAYTVTAANTGNVTLTSVQVTDTKVDSLSCTWPGTEGTLTPGQQAVCTGVYSTSAADVSAGAVTNTATATGKDPGNRDVTDTGSVTIPGPSQPAAIVVVKSADRSLVQSGQAITYTIVATNSGDATLTSVTVTDPLIPSLSCTWPGTPGTLAAGESVSCTGTYTPSSDAEVTNTVTASGTASGTTVQDTDTVVIPARTPGRPALSVVKSADPSYFVAENDEITYTVVVTNTGSSTADNVTVSDPTVTLALSPGGGTCVAATLAASASITCTGTYVVSGDDVTAGSVTNTVTATADPQGGVTPTGTDSVTISGEPPAAPALSIVKSSSPGAFSAAGQTLTYTITATNSGGTALTNASVSDPKLSGLTCSPTTPVASLAAGDTITCSGTYLTTLADVTAGSVSNTATARGTPPTGPELVKTTTVEVPGPDPNPVLTVVKSSSPASFSAVGQTLTFTVTAANTGNVTLTNVAISDPLLGTLTKVPSGTCSADSLAPGESLACTGTYVTDADDVAAGGVTNTATASGKDPGDNTVTDNGSTTVPGPTPAPNLAVVKSASPASFSAASQSITYTITAANTGNVTLSGVTVTDTKVTSLSCTWPTTEGTLAAGERVTCTGSYSTTQADVNAGSVMNTATVNGTPPSGPELEKTGTVTVPGPTPNPQLSVVKSSSPTSFSGTDQSITYSVTIANTGNVPVIDVTGSDSLLTLTLSPGGGACEAATLAVGASITCTGSRATTQADVDLGYVDNTASASGKDPQDNTISGSSTVRVPGPTPNPAILLTKSADPTRFVSLGQAVTYTLRVENTGNVTLTGVTLVDNKVDDALTCSGVTIPVASLAAGARFTCTGTHVVTQADLDAGGITNTATATGTKPAGGTVTSQASVLTPGPNGAISVIKTANRDSFTGAGQTVTFTVVATNVGNVTLTDVTVGDSLPSVTLSCSPTVPVASLAPLASISCTGSYVTQQADVSAGSLENQATATGTDPANVAVTDTGIVTVPAEGATPTPTPPTQSPEPSQMPTATPPPTPTATPSPRPVPTAGPTPAPERLPQVPKKVLPVPAQVSPFGTSVLLPATVITNAGQKAKVRVDCTIPPGKRGLVPVLLSPTGPKGDLRLCLVKRGKGGKVSVTVLFPPPVKVTMTLSAPAKGKYGPYKQVISYTTRMKKG